MIKSFIKIIALTLVVVISVSVFEPAKINAVEDTILVNLEVDSGISITSPPDVTMSNLGTSVNTSTGSAVWNVKTNDADGYNLSVRATATPALVSGTNSFLDYTEATPGTPDTWSIDASTIQFGFSGIGTDVENVNTDQYAASGQTVCDDGASSSTVNTTIKFLGFETSNQLLATRSATTTTSGVDTRICFAAGQNGVYAPSGLYQATIIATALAI
jgi:hypothetical protein